MPDEPVSPRSSDSVDVLIFEDDGYYASVVSALVQQLGHSSLTFYSGEEALEKIRIHRPRLVILDIMMPGMDGLSVCKAIRANADAGGMGVIIVSSKGYQQDREEAMRCGANDFVAKPFNPQKLLERLQGLLRKSPGAAAASPAHAARQPVLRARIWGSRNSAADADVGAMQSPCVSLALEDRLIVLDAGTGLRSLSVLPSLAGREVYFLLTHYHPDHVSGLPGLSWTSSPGFILNFSGPADIGGSLPQILRKSLNPDGAAKARIRFRSVAESKFSLWPDVTVQAFFVKHPGATLAYRIEYKKKTVVYCPDNEIDSGEDIPTDYNERLAAFIRGADLLIHDSRFTDEDFEAHRNQGHSCPRLIAEIASKEGVRTLVLFHFDAQYAAGRLDAALEQTRKCVRESFSNMDVRLGLEGTELLV